MNITKLKNHKSIYHIFRIEKDNIYYIDYTNYQVVFSEYSNLSENIENFRKYLRENKTEFLLQETFHWNKYILRIKSYR